jgi:uncharacterized protein
MIAVAVAVAVLVTVASAAGAHVTVVPSSAPKGSTSILSFSVPNERAAANTLMVEVNFPTDYAIPFVSVQPKPGWTVATVKTTLVKPVKTPDGEVTQAVTKVTWTATATGLKPGEFDLFTVSAGPLPTKPSRLAFPTLQTYSSGEVVRWIQPTVKGAPEPDNPVPLLKLRKAGTRPSG